MIQVRLIMQEVESTLLLDLPIVVIHEIFSYLSLKDLGRVAQVCRSLNEISCHETIWKRVSESFINVHAHKHIATKGKNER